jgi:osmotically-inducible protein OsmY
MTAIRGRTSGSMSLASRVAGGTATTVRKGASAAAKGAKGIANASYKAGKAVGTTTTAVAATANRLSSGARSRTSKAPVVLAGAAGAAGAYFFDPQSGNRRRAVARDKVLSFFRQGGRKTARFADQRARYAAGVAKGVVHEATPSAEKRPEEFNDPTLANKVESLIFREADSPKGRVSVNVENGVVYLRGELDSKKEIEELVEATSEVEGIRGVENLLHLPGEEAPSKANGRGKRRRFARRATGARTS